MTFLDHLLGPCVANVNHEKCCVRHDQSDSYRWWDSNNEYFVFGVIINCLGQIDWLIVDKWKISQLTKCYHCLVASKATAIPPHNSHGQNYS